MAKKSATKEKQEVSTPTLRRRKRSSEKERLRNIDLNGAFSILQSCLPSCVNKNGRLPRIKTLRLAVKYIEHLLAILRDDIMVTECTNVCRPVTIEDFATVAMMEMQVRPSYSDRIHELESDESSGPLLSADWNFHPLLPTLPQPLECPQQNSPHVFQFHDYSNVPEFWKMISS